MKYWSSNQIFTASTTPIPWANYCAYFQKINLSLMHFKVLLKIFVIKIFKNAFSYLDEPSSIFTHCFQNKITLVILLFLDLFCIFWSTHFLTHCLFHRKLARIFTKCRKNFTVIELALQGYKGCGVTLWKKMVMV